MESLPKVEIPELPTNLPTTQNTPNTSQTYPPLKPWSYGSHVTTKIIPDKNFGSKNGIGLPMEDPRKKSSITEPRSRSNNTVIQPNTEQITVTRKFPIINPEPKKVQNGPKLIPNWPNLSQNEPKPVPKPVPKPIPRPIQNETKLIHNRPNLVQIRPSMEQKRPNLIQNRSMSQNEPILTRNVPTTVSSSILGKLNLTMPKLDFSRSQSLDLPQDLKPKPIRDPRKRKSITRMNSLLDEPYAKLTKKPEPEPSSPSSGTVKKISIAQYLNKNNQNSLKQENPTTSERLPALPAVDELFTSQDSFEPESVQVPVRVPTPEDPVKEEPKEDFEKQYFSKRLKNTVSSWNVSKKTVRKTTSLSEG